MRVTLCWLAAALIIAFSWKPIYEVFSYRETLSD
jgi:hypothetical protein